MGGRPAPGRASSVVGEAGDHLVDHLILALGARQQLDGPIVGQMADEPAVVELPHRLVAEAARHGRHIGDMRAIAHRRHGRVDVAQRELGMRMDVE